MSGKNNEQGNSCEDEKQEEDFEDDGPAIKLGGESRSSEAWHELDDEDQQLAVTWVTGARDGGIYDDCNDHAVIGAFVKALRSDYGTCRGVLEYLWPERFTQKQSGAKGILDFDHHDCERVCPILPPAKIREFRKKDFNDFNYNFENQKYLMTIALMEIFPGDNLHICEQITEYAQNLFDGHWYTSERVELFHIDKGQVLGAFDKFLLVGKVYDTDGLIFHQHKNGSGDKRSITLWGKLNESHDVIDGFYWGGGIEQKAIQLFRRMPIQNRALEFIQNGDVFGMNQLIELEGYDVNSVTKETQNKRLLYEAIKFSQVGMAYFLLDNGADPQLKQSGRTPLQLAKTKRGQIDEDLIDLLEVKENEFMENYMEEELYGTPMNNSVRMV